MNLGYYLPLFTVIFSNIIYHNIAKNQPQNANPFLILGLSYLISAIITFLLFFINNGNFKTDLQNVNPAGLLLGFAIVGIELGYILMYRNGWTISTGALIANVTVALILLFIGFLVYKEQISAFQIIGTCLCLIGLFLVKIR